MIVEAYKSNSFNNKLVQYQVNKWNVKTTVDTLQIFAAVLDL